MDGELGCIYCLLNTGVWNPEWLNNQTCRSCYRSVVWGSFRRHLTTFILAERPRDFSEANGWPLTHWEDIDWEGEERRRTIQTTQHLE